MITPEGFRQLALYNQWQNEKLFPLCERIGEAERLKDRGMFFRSIHRTLDHIVVVDDALWFLLHEGVPKPIDFERMQTPDFAELWRLRREFDQKILLLAQSCTAEWLAGILAFPSVRLGRERRIPRGFYVLQMFNHQTHHRSQVTAELHRMGIDYGNTDLPYNPYLEF